MIPTAAFQSSTTVLSHLANPAARVLVLAAVAGLTLSAFRVRSTCVRLFTWTTVLYAALAMPLLGWILPRLAVPTPEFLQSALGDEVSPAASQNAAVPESTRVGTAAPGCPVEQSSTCVSAATSQPKGSTTYISQVSSTSPLQSPEASRTPSTLRSLESSLQWSATAAAIYLAVALILLTRFFVGLAFSRRLIRAAQPIADPRVTLRLSNPASSVVNIPRIAESDFISVPVTMGALRPTILLPSTWREWDDPKLDAVLAHELSHVTRRDALTQRLSLLHRAIFWFSPLPWWIDRHLANLAEQAADEAALFSGTDRKHYARILLDFFEALHAAPGRVWWQGVSMAHVSMAKSGQAEARVERILSSKGSLTMHLKKSIAVAVVALAVPLVYVTASAYPAHHVVPPTAQSAQDQAPPPAPAPTNAPQAYPHPEAAPAVVPDGVVGGVAAVIPDAPVPPRAPVAWSHRQSGSSYSSGRGYSYGYGDNQRFIIVTGKSDSLTMSGDMEDAHHVEKLRKSIAGDFIWFQSDEKSYVIRDQATIDRAKKLWAPQEELGKKQEALGKQQEILGKQQEELGSKMEQVQVKVPDMTAELDKLKAKLQQLGSSATMEQIADVQSQIGDLQSKLGDIQSQAGDQQGKLGEQQGALGEKQGKLGEEQGKLGEQQGKLAEEASRQMKSLLDEAIKKGIAQPEL